VVIGASSGGLNALSEMILHFQKGVNAAYCIVLHLSREGTGELTRDKICQITSLPCRLVDKELVLEKDNIYIAAPNQHVVVTKNSIKPKSGSKVNGCRPSIDVLFNSAANAFSEKSIGIILSGLIDDGILGMCAIKKAGGVCVVQDPLEAEFSVMPQSVIDFMNINHILSLSEMGASIYDLANRDYIKKGSGIEERCFIPIKKANA
jgi:two-component system chemotaxis response regulator CheB